MDPVILNPVILYGLLALGGVGVFLAMPRKGVSPQPIGALIAAVATGLLVLLLSLKAGEHWPNIYYYIFSAIALGGALRVITHPRPVYAALFFILTVLASSGLFVILAAEFLAFALVIVYAGAILITYLFVIMLATQAPTEEQVDVLADYDAHSREPLAATVVGFILLGVLTTLMFRGMGEMPAPGPSRDQELLAAMPRKVADAVKRPGVKRVGSASGAPQAAHGSDDGLNVSISGSTTFVLEGEAAKQAEVRNIEGVAFSLLRDHPGSIEIAGVILLMAMLGAVVLARKQVQLDEEAKARHAALLADDAEGAE